jgi:hypothetical protein
LDGSGSFDPDNDSLSYQWSQVSGPLLTLSDPNTATPTIQATPVPVWQWALNEQTAVLQLVVSDGTVNSLPDEVVVIVVPAIELDGCDGRSDVYEITIANDQFDTDKPTLIYFGGGNGICGGERRDHYNWVNFYNVILFNNYMPSVNSFSSDVYAYHGCGDLLITYLSSVAPEYDQPIQTTGLSTGGKPAISVPIWLNTQYQDPRYAVNLVSFFDALWVDYRVEEFVTNPVADEPAWAENYMSTEIFFNPSPYAVNICVKGDHTAGYYYFLGTPNLGTGPAVYNHGLTAGFYTSVAHHGNNYRITSLSYSPYFFTWIKEGQYWWQGHMEYYDQANYPGALPEPIELIGPADGSHVPATGVTLSCESSENTVAYDVFFGEDPQALEIIYTADVPPNLITGSLPPAKTLFWTIQARDAYGSTYRPDLRSLVILSGQEGDFNSDSFLDGTDCAIIRSAIISTWGDANFVYAADYNSDQYVDLADYVLWLDLYRSFHSDPTKPDPCAPTDPDDDNDGAGNSWDNCPATPNPNQGDNDHDGLGNLCDEDDDNDGVLDTQDNCPMARNPEQVDSDADGKGNSCDFCDYDPLDDIDGDGWCADEDNCPNTTNSGQRDIDGDGFGDACDCPNDPVNDVDGDGVCRDVDNCPAVRNPGQEDSDGDGVGDVCDDCPETPGIPVGPDGCSIIPADLDNDLDVDQEDFGIFQTCLSEFGIIPSEIVCIRAGRLQGSESVTQEDFAIFQACMSGPNVMGDINCAN